MGYAIPIVVAIAAWWLSTVLIIYRAGLPRRSFVATLVGATAILTIGIWALVMSRDSTGVSGAYYAFLGGLALWGWHEVSYLFGFISGPRPEPCPPDCTGWQRFVLGVKTCLYHEIAVLATVGVLAALLWNAENQVGLWTFVILWLMRWSAKLNIFLGVRNLHEEFWPEHLSYLTTFVRRRPMNELFPVSVLLATIGAIALVLSAGSAYEDLAWRAGATLLATLLALATLEHWLLVLRINDDVLWRPGMRSRRDGGAPAN